MQVILTELETNDTTTLDYKDFLLTFGDFEGSAILYGTHSEYTGLVFG